MIRTLIPQPRPRSIRLPLAERRDARQANTPFDAAVLTSSMISGIFLWETHHDSSACR